MTIFLCVFIVKYIIFFELLSNRFSKPLRIFTAVMAILIMITGLLGNLLTIIALSKYPKVRNVTAAFIIRYATSQYILFKLNNK